MGTLGGGEHIGGEAKLKGVDDEVIELVGIVLHSLERGRQDAGAPGLDGDKHLTAELVIGADGGWGIFGALRRCDLRSSLKEGACGKGYGLLCRGGRRGFGGGFRFGR